MKKYVITLFFIMIFSQMTVGQELNVNGYVRNYLGVLTEQEGDYSINQNTFNLELSLATDHASFFINPTIYSYSENDLDLNLREAYIDLNFNSLDIRIGKQQIIWGKADGVFITDLVSPKDLREFLLPDFDEIRLGVNAVKMNYYFDNYNFELVWMPQFQSTIFAEGNSIWSPSPPLVQPTLPPGFQLIRDMDNSKADIKGSLKNSEIAGKVSLLSPVMDFEIMAAYLWDDNPALHTIKAMDPANSTITITARPEYHRLTVGGGSFSTSIEGVVLRAEGAYYKGRNYMTMSQLAPEGVVEKDYIHYLFGVDYNILGIDISAQFMQEKILDYENDVIQDENRNTATLLINENFLNETLFMNCLVYYGFNEEDALIRPKITYKFSDGLEVVAGANIFIGEGQGLFGQYYNNDMIYTKIKYSF